MTSGIGEAIVEKSKSDTELDGALFDADESDAFESDTTSGEAFTEEGFVRPQDGKAEKATEVLTELLDHMGFDADVSLREDAQQITMNIEGPDSGRVIGKKGQTLDAMQFFINKVVNRHPEGRRHVLLDSGDYRERHDHSLSSMARRLAKRAVQYGRVITLEPMSARDRRVVHLALSKFSGVSTRSDGQGSDRRVQIVPNRRRQRNGSNASVQNDNHDEASDGMIQD